jgi:hypothetical protein
MSTDYRLLENVRACDMFDGRLEKRGVYEHIAAETTAATRFLTDRRNYLTVRINADGVVQDLTRGGMNAPQTILQAIEEAFETEIVSEYEGRYWGFESDEEYDKCMQEMEKADNEKFHADVVRYLKGEPHKLRPGTIGMLTAEQVKKHVADRPQLLDAENEGELRAVVEHTLWHADHVVTVTLTEQDLAFVDMVATHESDLPSA